MPNSKAKKAERKKAAEDLEEGVDSDFEERQELQEKVYGLATKMCGNLKCENRPSATHTGSQPAKLQCGRCKGQKYCNAVCQKADWPRHKYFCQSFSSTKIGVNKLRDKIAHFFQLFMCFPEHVADFILHVRELSPEDRGGHCSIHFDSAAILQKWIAVLEAQQLVEATRVLARTMFYTDDKSKRLKDAYKRSAVHREWIDNDARAAFEKFLWNSLQWDDEEGIMRQFRSCGVDLGPCGMVLGVSCIVNPADASQTNILMPFPILDPPIPPEDRKPWEPISLEASHPGDDDFQCPTQ